MRTLILLLASCATASAQIMPPVPVPVPQPAMRATVGTISVDLFPVAGGRYYGKLTGTDGTATFCVVTLNAQATPGAPATDKVVWNRVFLDDNDGAPIVDAAIWTYVDPAVNPVNGVAEYEVGRPIPGGRDVKTLKLTYLGN